MNAREDKANGAERIVEFLRQEQVDRVFGNPGSTELALIDAVTRSGDIQYILGLHEGCVVPMADGYAQATGRTAFVNLHTMSGLGNAVGVLANVRANGTPMVVTAGQQERQLLPYGPLLGYDLVSIARPVVKWAEEVRSEADLGVMLRRAFLDAAAPPAGPVFLSLPHDLMLSPAPTPLPPRSRMTGPGIAAGVDEIVSLLANASEPALIVGQELGTREGLAAVLELAERFSLPVYGAFSMQSIVFPPRHPLWQGDLPGFAAGISSMLERHDCVLYAGGQAFQLFGGPTGPLLAASTKFIHLAPSPEVIGRSQATALGTFGDLAATLAAVARGLPRRDRRSEPQEAAKPAGTEPTPALSSPGRLDGATACRIMLEALPPDAIVHGEFPAVGQPTRSMFDWQEPGQFYSSKQTIGWAMGASVGVSLGHERRRRSLALVGDGSAAFSLPALWTAARERVPVIFAIMDNNKYFILEAMTRMMISPGGNQAAAFTLNNPALDFVKLAKGFGVDAMAITDLEGLKHAMTDALTRDGPVLLHILID